jgi:hypothetical protein
MAPMARRTGTLIVMDLRGSRVGGLRTPVGAHVPAGGEASGRPADALFAVMAVLLFFPSVTFGVIVAEIFPWALLFSALYLRRITPATLVLVGMLSLSALYTAFFASEGEGDALRSLAAYLNFILPFACFMQLPRSRLLLIRRVAKATLWFLIALGFLQVSGIASPLEPVFSALVPRARAEALAEIGGRGVTLLSSEPARAGIELALLYFGLRITSKERNRLVIWDLLFPAYVALVIRSAGATVFALICVALTAMRVKGGSLLLVIPLVAIAIIGAPTQDNRALDLLTNLASSATIGDGLFLLTNESGHRLVALYAFIASGLTHPFGSGVGNWMASSIDALTTSGIDYGAFRYFQIWGEGGAIGVRAPGILANLMLDVGFLGSIVFGWWLFLSSKRHLGGNKIAQVTLILLLLKISLFGSLGEPLPWIVFALALRLSPAANTSRPQTQYA